MKILKNTLTISFIFILFFMVHIVAAKTYQMGTFLIPLMVIDKDKGIFVELFKEAARRVEKDFEIVIFPTKRTFMYFHKGKIDGFFPALDKSAGEKAAKSSTIYSKNNVVFVKKGAPFIFTIKELEGKLVGLTRGYSYSEDITLNKNIKFYIGISDVINMKKLSKGEIDAFVVEEKSGIKALKESGVKNVHYNLKKPLYGKRVFFAFQPTDEGRSLAEEFSKALAEMKKDGTFAKIMGVYK